ncbi:MAG: oligosaccharide flippase family protein [Gammaproteobacteria bacterium]|nr:oligosaccharide flippase family protein [Gammaproteobacteria bacterium]MCP5136686.1 oligosaccharide flippase family protein [Gammaproteobacteria bacterium]
MRWILNIATSYLKFLINIVVVFFMTPYIVKMIGIDAFGLWSLIFAVIGIFGLMDMGFATAGVKYVAETVGSGDTERRNRILGTLFGVYSMIGIVAILAVAITVGPASGWFDLDAEHQTEFGNLVWWLGIALALSFPLSVFKSALTAAGRMDLVNGISLFLVLSQAALTVVLLEMGWGLQALAVAAAVNMVGQSLLLVPFAYRYIPGFSVAPSLYTPKLVRELLSFSVYAFIANIAVLIILRIDPVVIKLFLPLSAVAVYAIASRVAEYTYLLNKQFSNALMPLVSQSHGAGDAETVRRVLIDGTRFLMGVAIPFIGLLFFYTPEIIDLWMGPDFAEAAPLLRILLMAALFSTVQLNAANVLGMTGHHKLVAGSMALSALLNLGLSIVLIQIVALPGVAFATLLAAFIVEMGVIVPKACATKGVRYWDFVRDGVLPAIPAAVPMFAIAYGLATWIAPIGLGNVSWQGAIAGLAYLLVFLFTGVRADERTRVFNKIGARRRRNG